MKEKVKFIQLSDSEVKFEYKGHKFILKEKDRGFYGAGRSVGLYGLDGLNKNFIISVGWVKPDSQPSFRDDLIKSITNWGEIKKESIKYLDKLLS